MSARSQASPSGTLASPRLEPEDSFRVPSAYPRCRRARCHQKPVADMRRSRHNYRQGRTVDAWWAYCGDHLAEYNREVRDGHVWWRGAHVGDEYACGNCQRTIRLAPGSSDPEAEDAPYWYHVAHSSIWCDGWGDPADTGREAALTRLDPAVRDLLAAVRATLFAPYADEARVAIPIIGARVLTEEFAEIADAGRVRFADRVALAGETG